MQAKDRRISSKTEGVQGRAFEREKDRQRIEGVALKILINGGYGVFGSGDYSYYDPRVAELVTACGRYTLSKMQDIAAKDMDFDIVYGDTDSLFLNNPSNEFLSKFQDLFNNQLDIELEIKNTYFNLILSEGKKHYIGYGLNDKGEEALDIVGYEGKKSDRPEFVNNVFLQLANDVAKDNIDPIPALRKAMSDLDSGIVNPELLKCSIKLSENPEDYDSQNCRPSKIGKALGARKGELVGYFDSDIKKIGKSWSTNPEDIDIPNVQAKVMEYSQRSFGDCRISYRRLGKGIWCQSYN